VYLRRVIERAVADQDLPELWRIHAETMRDYVAATYGWDDTVQEEMFRDDWERKRDRRVLIDGDCIVAVWQVVRRDGQLFLGSIEVTPSYQGRGIGTAILTRLLADAASAGLTAALTVMKVNTRARQLYERLGFAVAGETATHLQMTVGATLAPASDPSRPR
jgi:ribosomal protein S18 acetylase RimI-like enzyme